ncbi:MAG: 1-phosphofructokinase family hexose kinase [Propionibacteriaceae bacterium]|nr:1-phosphofructokinase family hexose kinase [Propionibacteriaceae bacterium]
MGGTNQGATTTWAPPPTTPTTPIQRPRVITVTLNAAIDTRLTVEAIRPGTVTRASRGERSPGGKGLNVARVAVQLGAPVLATGFLAGHAGRFISEQLTHTGIDQRFVWVEGESRTCLNLIDAGGRSTEVLEPGVDITPDQLAGLESLVVSLISPGDAVVFSGSLPPGCPPDTYARLIRAARAAGALTVLDSSGEPLRQALTAHPDVIKPNAEEASALTGRQIDSPADAAALARTLGCDHGIAAVVCSLGGNGAVLACDQGAWWAEPPTIQPLNTVGCGDALVAGLSTALVEGRGAALLGRAGATLAGGTGATLLEDAGASAPDHWARCLVDAVTVATAAALSATTGSVDRSDLDQVRRRGVRLHDTGESVECEWST